MIGAQNILYGGKMGKVVFEHSSRKGQMFEGHHHQEIEVYFLVSGQRYYYIDNQTYLVMPRDLVVIREDLPHRVFSAGYGQFERYIIYIDRKFVSENLTSEAAQILFNIFDSDTFVYRLQNPAKIESLYRKMYTEGLAKPKGADGRKMLTELASELLDEVSASLNEYSPTHAKTSYVNKNILQIAAFINQSHAQKLSLDLLAQKFNLSKYYLCKLFKNSFGYTFSDFLNHVRITEACKLLESSDLSVAEIAQKTGYSDIAYFCRVFKKIIGISALKYRKSSEK